MTGTKFIRISLDDELPPYGTNIMLDHSGILVMARFNVRTIIDIFKADYKYFLREVPDIEQELIHTLDSTSELLDKSIEQFQQAKEKIEYYKQEIEKLKE